MSLSRTEEMTMIRRMTKAQRDLSLSLMQFLHATLVRNCDIFQAGLLGG